MGHSDMITIDGSQGEGGGQVLRTALGLSLATGKPFSIEKIRAGRKKPGLLAQHLAAVRAAAEIGRAEVEGAEVGSARLRFVPREVRPGDYRFVVGTAGSATLVFQTVLPALMTAGGPSHLRLEGGTHNPWAPPFDFLTRTFLPLLGRMGPQVEAELQQPGFYPAGGGAFTVTIQPQRPLGRLELLHRGEVLRRSVRAVVSRLPLNIAQREARTVQEAFDLPDECVAAEPVESAGPGNAVMIEIQCEYITEVFVGFGQKGVPAETVARQVVEEARRYLAADVPVGEHLADQLLIPLALAGGGKFRTLAPSSHTMTNMVVLRRFVEVGIDCQPIGEDRYEITVAT
jgi:RNA 3'-terminal phosphate cyclase (ATP)